MRGNNGPKKRFSTGFKAGLWATGGMTLIMLLGTFTGVAPMPKPIPIALAKLVLGNVAFPVLVVSGLIAHFAYGGVAGGIFTRWSPAVRVWSALVWGIVLWLGMQVIFLPLLGWGVFGAKINPRIAVATFILHLIYGSILGGVASKTTRK
ncbi:MAG: hypothetical protein ACE5JS_04445 [Nitrospinota bacterium]